jgi:hypothetical protein
VCVITLAFASGREGMERLSLRLNSQLRIVRLHPLGVDSYQRKTKKLTCVFV